LPLVTCAALALALANPASTGPLQLIEDCVAGKSADGKAEPALRVTVRFDAPLVVEAAGRRVEGLAIDNGGNITWQGGEIVAPGGAPQRGVAGAQFYAVLVNRGDAVTLDGVHLTDARKAVTVRSSSRVTLRNAHCDGLVEDCMIVSDSQTIQYLDNVIGPFKRYLPLCERGGVVTQAVPRRDCEGSGGTWTDGWHSDALQLRNGTSDVLARGNRIATTGQGLTQMDAPTDRPLANVRFENNVIAAGRHGLTLTNCDGCRISGNRLTTSVPGWKSVVKPGKAMACGNDVPDGGPGRDKCPS
jgi:hypothetical protein